MPQNNTSAGSNRRQERFGVLDITIKRMDSFDERVSMFFSPASPGVLAAHRRLSGLASAASPPPVTEKPYLAGRVVASAVSSRLSEKAQLLQYLSGHGGTVNRMLGTLPEQPCTSRLATTPDAVVSLSSTAPAACMSSCPNLAEVYHTPVFRQSNMSIATGSMNQSTGSKASTGSAASRGSSVSAYLRGQQDVLTTIAGADARALAGGTSGILPASLPCGQDKRAQNNVSTNRSDASTCSSAAYAAGASRSFSRHSAVKNALTARMSAATGTRGSVSPRYHEASLSVREALLTEGRARRSLAAVTLPAPLSGSTAAGGYDGADHGPVLRNQYAAQRSTSHFYSVDSDKSDHVSGCAMEASWQQGQSCGLTGTLSRVSTGPPGMGFGQHAIGETTAMQAAAEDTWISPSLPVDAMVVVPEQVYREDFSRIESSNDSASDGCAPGARQGRSSSSSGEDGAVLGSKVRGWRQRLSSVKVARGLVRSSGRQTSSSSLGTTSGLAVPTSLTSTRCHVLAAAALTRPQGRRYSAAAGVEGRPQGKRCSAAGAGASAGAVRQTASFKQRGTRRSALNRWSSSHSNQESRSHRRYSNSSSSDASSRRETNSSSDGQKRASKVRGSMYQQRLSASQRQQQAGTSGWSNVGTQVRLGRQRVSQGSWLPAAAAKKNSASGPCLYTTSIRRYSQSRTSTDSSSSSSHSSLRNERSDCEDEWVPAPAAGKVSHGKRREVHSGTGCTRPNRRSIGLGKPTVLFRSQPCSAEVRQRRRQLAVSLLQKVGRQLHRRSQGSSSNSEDGQSLRRSVSGDSGAKRGSVARGQAAVSMTVFRRSSSSSSNNNSDNYRSSFSSSRNKGRFSSSSSRTRGSSQQRLHAAAATPQPRQLKEGAAPGDISTATAARRSLSGALECMLNPADKPSHRMSLTASDAAAVVLGRSSRTHPRHSSSFKLGAANSRRLSAARMSAVNLRALRRSSSYGSSAGALGHAGSYTKQTQAAPRLSTADSAVGGRRPSAFLRACLRSEHTAVPRRSGAAPRIMARPGRKSWAQVYEEAVGVLPLAPL